MRRCPSGPLLTRVPSRGLQASPSTTAQTRIRDAAMPASWRSMDTQCQLLLVPHMCRGHLTACRTSKTCLPLTPTPPSSPPSAAHCLPHYSLATLSPPQLPLCFTAPAQYTPRDNALSTASAPHASPANATPAAHTRVRRRHAQEAEPRAPHTGLQPHRAPQHRPTLTQRSLSPPWGQPARASFPCKNAY